MRYTLSTLLLISLLYSCENKTIDRDLDRAITLFNSDSTDKALLLFKQVLETGSSPQKSTSYYYVGKIESQRANYSSAITNFSASIKLGAVDDPVTLNDRGFAFQRQGELDSSINDFNKAISLDSHNHIYLNNRGFSYMKLKKSNSARSDFETSITLKSDYAPSYNNFGVLEYQLGNYERAVEMAGRAVELNPDYLEAHLNLSYALVATQQVSMAVVELQTIKQLDSTFYRADYLMGIIEIALGDTLEGCALVRKAIKFDAAKFDAQLNEICAAFQ